MIIHKRNFDGNRRIYFLIKEEKVFIEYTESLEKVSNIIKNKFNNEPTYSNKYLKAETNKRTRRLSILISANNID